MNKPARPTSQSDELRQAAHKAMDAYLDAGGTDDFVIISRRDIERNTPETLELDQIIDDLIVEEFEEVRLVTPEDKARAKAALTAYVVRKQTLARIEELERYGVLSRGVKKRIATLKATLGTDNA